ncbi:MAG: hypothetical protein ACE5NP_12035, partial [Anaerolineae bacterium]
GIGPLEAYQQVSKMNTKANLRTPEATKSRILVLLAALPPESLAVVEQFVRFLHQQIRQAQPVATVFGQGRHPPYIYPTVAVPPSSLDGWLNLVPEGYEGDALADTEALYDEV